ncbi:GNAT family N-acetyltransferase [Anaerocolumna sp. MB42-C2]|uniref:GNAT family N-acetyltransferase n=1 Tax=Anaerocolumna sp. MB42-C2 TaxID=3070997 RepID=UPI0027E0EE84|nr:GNAT family N-acetyltransferase [Anaerocolumna sp. MB42-C2]WMJ87869.1 GNAT family N-acetyltransferase [Anaerocolumna sp. MB42-C2]
MIKKYSVPNEEIIKEIKAVETICKEYDKLNGYIFLDTSINFNPEMKSLFLLYKDDKLVSLISVFTPTSEEAELSAYTLPEYRRKGYFKSLLSEVIQELKFYNISDIILVCEPQSKEGIEAIKGLKAELEFTEYFLRYKDSLIETGIEQLPEIMLEKAKQKDLETIIHLSQEIFHDNYDDAKSLITKTFNSYNRVQYMAVLGSNIIGMVSVGIENDEVSIFGLGITPQYQGKGYGQIIMKLLLKKLKSSEKDNITIEVDSSNDRAFKLYKKLGFIVETSFDYYRKRIN